jgi:hypothetical protein
MAGIEARLPATGDLVGANDLVPEPFQNPDHADAHIGKHQVDKAGNEQGNGHGFCQQPAGL